MIMMGNMIENTNIIEKINIRKIEDINIIDNIPIIKIDNIQINKIENIHIHKIEDIHKIDNVHIIQIEGNNRIQNPLKQKILIKRKVFKMWPIEKKKNLIAKKVKSRTYLNFMFIMISRIIENRENYLIKDPENKKQKKKKLI